MDKRDAHCPYLQMSCCFQSPHQHVAFFMCSQRLMKVVLRCQNLDALRSALWGPPTSQNNAGFKPPKSYRSVFRQSFLVVFLAAAALDWCKVLGDRWVLIHDAVRASFRIGSCRGRACQPVRFTPLWWLAFWVCAMDKSRTSRFVMSCYRWRLRCSWMAFGLLPVLVMFPVRPKFKRRL